jgi:hypothetical protein
VGGFEVAGISVIDGSNITGNYKGVWLTGTKTIKLSSDGNLIRTAATQTFIIDGPTLEGKENNNDSLVYVENGSTVELLKGAISGNTTTHAGGVYVLSGGTFNMSGGTISGNTSTSDGGGLCVHGTFNMSGGIISDNKATSSGGGVRLLTGNFNMSGGTFSKNDAGTSGGGVNVNNGTFTMTGGIIYGKNDENGNENTAKTGEGAAFRKFGGTATLNSNPLNTMYDDTIPENPA